MIGGRGPFQKPFACVVAVASLLLPAAARGAEGATKPAAAHDADAAAKPAAKPAPDADAAAKPAPDADAAAKPAPDADAAARPDADAAAKPAPAPNADATAPASPTAEESRPSKPSTAPGGRGESGPANPPAPAPPSRNEQSPHPYLREPPPDEPARNVEVGPLLAVSWRSASGSGASYPASPAYGASARIDAFDWLGLRALVLHTDQSVTLRDTSATHQPDLDVLLLAARIEPSVWLAPRLRAWAGLSAGWLRTFAPPVDGDALATSTRRGNGLEVGAAVGASYDVVEHWLAVGVWAGGAWITAQSGDMFGTTQAVSGAGRLTSLPGLPEYGAALHAGVGLELLL